MKKLQPSEEFFRYRFLMGAMQKNALATTVRLMCLQEEVDRIDEITHAWRAASETMTELAAEEAGLPDRISMTEPPGTIARRLKEIEEDPLFRASFSAVPTDFKRGRDAGTPFQRGRSAQGLSR